MSGVAGADRVKSRSDFCQFISSYSKLIEKFSGFVGLWPSGSFNSDTSKQDFGDIDLVVQIDSKKNKRDLKKDLQQFFHTQSNSVIVPFTSKKYFGKRSYNSGEIVTVRYFDELLGYSVQIDNIIALDSTEANFKQQFLNFPATKQGLILGLVKVATVETDPAILFSKIGIDISAIDPSGVYDIIGSNEEYEFSLSSVELQLRKVTFVLGHYKPKCTSVLWKSRNISDLSALLYQYDLNADFNSLLEQAVITIKNARSLRRIPGVFTSMVSVKSGEVGTEKGAEKMSAINKIKQTFVEPA
jgi:hypothetical protein